jgi:hypothetical protein
MVIAPPGQASPDGQTGVNSGPRYWQGKGGGHVRAAYTVTTGHVSSGHGHGPVSAAHCAPTRSVTLRCVSLPGQQCTANQAVNIGQQSRVSGRGRADVRWRDAEGWVPAGGLGWSIRAQGLQQGEGGQVSAGAPGGAPQTPRMAAVRAAGRRLPYCSKPGPCPPPAAVVPASLISAGEVGPWRRGGWLAGLWLSRWPAAHTFDELRRYSSTLCQSDTQWSPASTL